MEESVRDKQYRIERSKKKKENLKSMFNFNDGNIKRDFVVHHRLDWKLRQSFVYLMGKLPENTPTTKPKDIKMSEGKNYDFYYFNCGEELKLILRTYGSHLTLYLYNTHHNDEYNLRSRVSVIVIEEDNKLIPDELHDQFIDDPLISFRKILPQIIKINKEGDIEYLSHMNLELDPWTKKKEVYANENPYNLDLLIFACDEIFSKYLTCFAENEVIERLKELKVGDKFGNCREITGINSDLKDEYYHSVGIFTKRTDEFGMLHENKDEFHDVYSLCRWKFDELFPMEDFKVNTPEIY